MFGLDHATAVVAAALLIPTLLIIATSLINIFYIVIFLTLSDKRREIWEARRARFILWILEDIAALIVFGALLSQFGSFCQWIITISPLVVIVCIVSIWGLTYLTTGSLLRQYWKKKRK